MCYQGNDTPKAPCGLFRKEHSFFKRCTCARKRASWGRRWRQRGCEKDARPCIDAINVTAGWTINVRFWHLADIEGQTPDCAGSNWKLASHCWAGQYLRSLLAASAPAVIRTDICQGDDTASAYE